MKPKQYLYNIFHIHSSQFLIRRAQKSEEIMPDPDAIIRLRRRRDRLLGADLTGCDVNFCWMIQIQKECQADQSVLSRPWLGRIVVWFHVCVVDFTVFLRFFLWLGLFHGLLTSYGSRIGPIICSKAKFRPSIQLNRCSCFRAFWSRGWRRDSLAWRWWLYCGETSSLWPWSCFSSSIWYYYSWNRH